MGADLPCPTHDPLVIPPPGPNERERVRIANGGRKGCPGREQALEILARLQGADCEHVPPPEPVPGTHTLRIQWLSEAITRGEGNRERLRCRVREARNEIAAGGVRDTRQGICSAQSRADRH